MNDISNYEYTVLKRLQDAGGCIAWSSLDTETATACAQLAVRNLVFNGVAEVDGVLKTAAAISPSGSHAVQNYTYDVQLRAKEARKERRYGFFAGILSTITAELAILAIIKLVSFLLSILQTYIGM